MLLVGSDFDVVGRDSRLVFVGIIKTLGIAEITDIYGGDVVTLGKSRVKILGVLSDIGAV